MKLAGSRIETIGSDLPARRAAGILLRDRLGAVTQAIPAAAKSAEEDPECVHRLRVATRRAMAAVELVRKLIPSDQRKWFRGTLKDVRHAADEARDHDVLIARLAVSDKSEACGRLLERCREGRRQAQEPIQKVHHHLIERGRLSERIESLLASLREPGTSAGDGEEPFGAWAENRLQRFVRRFRRASRCRERDAAELHAFRIRGKELRYILELSKPVFKEEPLLETLHTIENLQDRLGEIHDHYAAAQHLDRWLDESMDEEERVYLRRSRQFERRSFADSVDAFDEWWTERRRRKFLGRLKKLGVAEWNEAASATA